MRELVLPKNCYGYTRPALLPRGAVVHYMSALYANGLGLDNSNPYSVDVCVDILKALKLSAHVLIDRDGEQYRLVPFNRQAFHAGISMLDGRTDCNTWTLSVELLSTGKPHINGDPAYTPAQIDSVISLLQGWINTYGMVKARIRGHDDIRSAAIAAGMRERDGSMPSVKRDPGPHFPWQTVFDKLRFV